MQGEGYSSVDPFTDGHLGFQALFVEETICPSPGLQCMLSLLLEIKSHVGQGSIDVTMG